MQALNLANRDDPSSLKWKLTRFPDGQRSINVEKPTEDVLIKSRMTSFIDIELIICAVAVLRDYGIQNIHLFAPYMLGARSDRKFTDDGPNYLKDVVAPIINNLGFKSVTVVDAHSKACEAHIKNLINIPGWFITKWALGQWVLDPKTCAIMCPDRGAKERSHKTAEYVGIEQVGNARKLRNVETGQILEIVVTVPDEKNLIVVDDICDGGATFKMLADKIPPDRNLYLVVTHGIFSKGLSPLMRYKGIATTNSISQGVFSDKLKMMEIFTRESPVAN